MTGVPAPSRGGRRSPVSGGELVPDFATHYYRASRAPFLSLSDLPDEQATAVMAEPGAQATVTWGDSFAAMEVTRDFGLAFAPRPYYGRLYRLADIAGPRGAVRDPETRPGGLRGPGSRRDPGDVRRGPAAERRAGAPLPPAAPLAAAGGVRLGAAPPARLGRARRAPR